MKTDLYQRVTDAVISSLEQGVRPWVRPWNAEHAAGRISRPLRCNGQPYQGVNVLVLWMESMEKGFSAPLWMTFKQALELGGNVRKGERGSHVVYASTYVKGEEGEEQQIPFLKSYTVFNAEQIDNLPSHFYAMAQTTLEPMQRIEAAEAFFHSVPADVRHGGNMAYCSGSAPLRRN
jgi:antirestriction protein ArdC